MHQLPFLADLALILGAAVVVVLVSHRLRLPAVVGLLLTGVLLGPSGLGWVADPHEVEIFAEIGVVALLFTIGLEFSLARLRSLQRLFFLGGGIQVLGTLAVGAALALGLGLRTREALFAGMLLALSSTAIVLKLYADRRQVDSPHGKAVTAILLFQDFAIVPMLLLTPVLAGRVEASPAAVAGRFAAGLAVVGVVFWLARTLVPRLLHLVTRTRLREVLVLAAVAGGLGLGALTEELGFSFAVGAFLAGIVISESEYSHQVFAEVLPFRDIFNSLFFISIGMLLNLGFAADHLPWVVGTSLVVVLVKAGLVTAVVRLLAYPPRTALLAGLSLAQVGEFSFVVLEVGADNGLVGNDLYQVFLASTVITMLATPFLIEAAPWLADRLRSPHRPEDEAEMVGLEDHVVLVGFGAGGERLGRVLEQANIPWVAVELAGDKARAARGRGLPVVYGDGTRQEILEHVHLERAELLVISVDDPEARPRIVAVARQVCPEIHTVVRTRRLADVEALYGAGADEVVTDELESSIELFTRVLTRYQVPANVIEAEGKILRGQGYRMLRGVPAEGALSDAVVRELAQGTTAVFFIEPGHAAAGRTLAELELRRQTGASAIAVVRDDSAITNPGPDLELAAGDHLVLVGGHADIRRAFEVLEGR